MAGIIYAELDDDIVDQYLALDEARGRDRSELRRCETDLRTVDLRLWLTGDEPWPALNAFLEDVRRLAEERHPDVSVRWVQERRYANGRPRFQPSRHRNGGAPCRST
jgi:hypothetical protein